MSLFLIFSVLVNIGFMVSYLAQFNLQIGGQGEDEFPALEERWSYGEGEVKAVRIPVQGVLFRESSGGLFAARHDPIENILQQIRAAGQDPDVKALILKVDSPGGAITPVDEIYDALLRFKASDEQRVIVVFMKDIAASGGYYVAMAADWIVAEPTSIVGSVGVIMQALNWKELADKAGLKATTIKSGENKDILNPFEETKPEQVALLQNLIDTAYDRFRGLVVEARGLDEGRAQELLDGRIFTAQEALSEKLVDELGYWDDAMARTATLLGEPSVKVVRYQRTPHFMDVLAELRVPAGLRALREALTPNLQLLWRP